MPYLAPLDELVENHYIASTRNHVQRLLKLTPVIWTAKIFNLRLPETIYCRHAHLSPYTLRRKQWRWYDNGALVERILQALKILGIRLMSLSQQYEPRQGSSKQVIFVRGSWLNSFHFTILASHTSCDQDFKSLELKSNWKPVQWGEMSEMDFGFLAVAVICCAGMNLQGLRSGVRCRWRW